MLGTFRSFSSTSVHYNITILEAIAIGDPNQPFLPLLLPLLRAQPFLSDVWSTSCDLNLTSILSKRPHLHSFCVFCLFLWSCLEVGAIALAAWVLAPEISHTDKDG